MPNIDANAIAVTMRRLLRRKELEQSLGLSRSAIYARLDPKSPQHDPNFPRPIKLGSLAVAWVESEVQCYIAGLIEDSRNPR
ncbi:MAG: AlpA family phage regulatory protein [Pseudomonadota bacterium]